MTITKDDDIGSIAADNRITIDKLLLHFGWENLGATKETPLPSGFDPSSDLAQPDDKFERYVFLGFISYLAATCRMDLKAPLNALAHWTTKWNSQCTLACKHLARYLVKTRTLGLKWTANNSLPNKVISFSDFGSHKADRSMGGYVIMLNGAAISSRAFSIKQVVTSTGAGEARALYECVNQLTHVLGLVAEFGFDQGSLSNPVFCDSQTVLASVLGEKKLKRSKQYAIYINYVKEHVQSGLIHLRYCESSLQCADIMTKATFPNSQHFTSLRNMAMGQFKEDVARMEATGKIIAISKTVSDEYGRPLYQKNGIKRTYEDQILPGLQSDTLHMAPPLATTATKVAEYSHQAGPSSSRAPAGSTGGEHLEMAEHSNTGDSANVTTAGVNPQSTPEQESIKAE